SPSNNNDSFSLRSSDINLPPNRVRALVFYRWLRAREKSANARFPPDNSLPGRFRRNLNHRTPASLSPCGVLREARLAQTGLPEQVPGLTLLPQGFLDPLDVQRIRIVPPPQFRFHLPRGVARAWRCDFSPY